MEEEMISTEEYLKDLPFFVDLRDRWLIRLAKELDAMGEDADGVLTEVGWYDGVELAGKIGPMSGADEMVRFLTPEGPGMELYQNEREEMTPDRAVLIGHNCSGIEEWFEMGLTAEDRARMCDVLTNRDRGLAHSWGFDLELDKSIARGDPICRLIFTRKKQ